MRSFVLAVLASAVVFSPALAHAQYGRSVSATRATYANRRGATPTKFVGNVNAAAVSSQYTEAAVYEGGGHACGCSTCQKSCCHEPILGNLLDNAVDLFISLAPCPRPCRGCAMPARCCPYPDVNCDPSCQPSPFFNKLFPCHKLGCGHSGGCTSCAKPACDSCTTKPACTSCTSRGHGDAYETILPPTPEVDMKPNPFGDDPPALEGATRPAPQVRTSNRIKPASGQLRNWYKTTNRAPITSPQLAAPRRAAPPVFVADDASPIAIRE